MSVITLSVIMLYVVFKLKVIMMSHMGYNEHQFAECPYSECHTECPYAECRCADSYDTIFNTSLTLETRVEPIRVEHTLYESCHYILD
jgi:hypothetical protein